MSKTKHAQSLPNSFAVATRLHLSISAADDLFRKVQARWNIVMQKYLAVAHHCKVDTAHAIGLQLVDTPNFTLRKPLIEAVPFPDAIHPEPNQLSSFEWICLVQAVAHCQPLHSALNRVAGRAERILDAFMEVADE